MKQNIVFFLFFISLTIPVKANVSLWCLEQQTGQIIDLIESTVEQLINSTGTPQGCAFIEVGQANVVGGLGGQLSLTTSGNYCLTEDIVADITINGSNIFLDLNGHQISFIQISSLINNGGHISIDGAYNTVINGSIITAPRNVEQFSVTILSSGLNTTLQSLIVSTQNGNDDTRRSASGIHDLGTHTKISSCNVITGNGNIGAGTGGIAGNGIVLEGNSAQIILSNILSGDGGGFPNAILNGFNGGTGIVINGIKTLVQNCLVKTGNGGPSASQASPPVTGTSGNGGIGILIQSNAIDSRVINTTIEKTGNGGRTDQFIGFGLTFAAGGNGGNGIQINNGAQRTLIYNCKINNTGQPTTSVFGTGVGGKAILDSVPNDSPSSNDSKVFKNIAANIANAIKFDLAALGIESGTMSPNPPTATSLNPWTNIYL